MHKSIVLTFSELDMITAIVATISIIFLLNLVTFLGRELSSLKSYECDKSPKYDSLVRQPTQLAIPLEQL